MLESNAEYSDVRVSVLEHLAEQRLKRGEVGIIDSLTHQFEAALIKTALAHTGGRRVEAAHLLGLGRNTVTRKLGTGRRRG